MFFGQLARTPNYETYGLPQSDGSVGLGTAFVEVDFPVKIFSLFKISKVLGAGQVRLIDLGVVFVVNFVVDTVVLGLTVVEVFRF